MPCPRSLPLMFGLVLAASLPARANETFNLDEVVVTGTRTPHSLAEVPVATSVLSRQDIATSNAHNLVEILRTLPGIQADAHDDVFGTYTWRATLRGLSINDGYGLVLVDGQRVKGSGQSGGMGEYGIGLNQIPLAMVERIEVVKGPASALYGSDALAGVINIITRKAPERPVASAGVSYGWYQVQDRVTAGSVEQPSDHGHSRNTSQAHLTFGDRPWKRFGYLVNYAYESAEDVSKDPLRSDRHSLRTTLEYRASDELALGLGGVVSDYQKTGNREEKSLRLSPSLTWRPDDHQQLLLSGSTYRWDFSHGYPGYSYGYKHGKSGFDQATFQYSKELPPHGQTLTLGGEFQKEGIDYLIENPDNTLIRVDEQVRTRSGYGQDEIQVNDRLTLVPGLRLDDHSVFGTEINPKLSLSYQLDARTTLRGSAGRAFKSPTIRQLYYDAPYRHGSYYVQSNRNLKPEKAVGYSASLERCLPDQGLLLNLGLFRNEIDDMVVREDSGTLYNSLPLLVYQNVEEAVTQGMELGGRFEGGDFFLRLAYTYTDSENKSSGRDLVYVPRHQLTLLPGYWFEEYDLTLSATIAVTGKQYTNSDNSAQINGHTVVDLKLVKELADKANLSLALDNLFDSDKGDESHFRVGRAITVSMNLDF